MKKLFAIACLLAPLLFSNCKETEAKADVSFAQTTFESLVRGDSSAIERIDWDTFSSLGTPVGTEYSAIASDLDKEKFRSAFVTQFSSSFRDSGGSVEDFTNWRVLSSDATHTKAAADSKNGTLTIIVSERDSVERVSSIAIAK